MTPEDQAKLKVRLELDEEWRESAYADSLGYVTIGFGRMIDARKGGKISKTEGYYLLDNDIYEKKTELEQYPWYTSQDSVRQAALLNMAFNLGVAGLLKFPHFLLCISNKDYPGAVANVVNTPWHVQTGPRADRIIALIQQGAWPS